MTLKVGRMSLKTPIAMGVTTRRLYEDVDSLAGTQYPANTGIATKQYRLRGRDGGASDPTTVMTAWDKEMARLGSVYVVEDSTPALLTEGYYEIMDGEYERPPGAPRSMPWELTLAATPAPVIFRQADDDNVAGTDTPETTASEGSMVVWTPPNTTETAILDPRNVSGAEALNLPQGTWKVIARVQSRTTITQQFRAKLTNLAGTDIAVGSLLSVTSANTWTELDLGSLTVPAANDKANWYKLNAKANPDLNDIYLDRVRVYPA